VQKFAEKFLALIIWDQDGIIIIDYLPKGQTINAEYYSSLLVQLKDILKEKTASEVTKGVLLLPNNGPAHRTCGGLKYCYPEETDLLGLSIY
jgi:hypothetical protein